MEKQTKKSNEVAEKNYEPNEKNKTETAKSLKIVHEQINDAYNQGTVDEKKKQKENNDKQK